MNDGVMKRERERRTDKAAALPICFLPKFLRSLRKEEAFFFIFDLVDTWGRDSSVGTATRYGLDGPGMESRWGGRDFPHPFRPALGPTQPPIQWVPGLSRG